MPKISPFGYLSYVELRFIEDDPDGGYTAKVLSESIFTQADDMETLRIMIRDAFSVIFLMKKNVLKLIVKLNNFLPITPPLHPPNSPIYR
ncbi:MAG: type II toxin-antitoxin system HicB family antitoxin [Gloeotrichia echinulata GP01]